MTDQESFVLMGFLRKLINTRTRYKDPLAEKLINESIAVQPNANYLLVQRAIFLELELERLQAQISKIPEGAKNDPSTINNLQFLGDSFDHWGKNLENNSSSISSDNTKTKRVTLEDRIIQFLVKNSIKLWILVLAVSVLIFFIRRA
jgi:hypothetical protein